MPPAGPPLPPTNPTSSASSGSTGVGSRSGSSSCFVSTGPPRLGMEAETCPGRRADKRASDNGEMSAPRQLVEAVGSAFRNVDVRRVEIAWGAAITAEWAHFVAFGVFAYEYGGVSAGGGPRP